MSEHKWGEWLDNTTYEMRRYRLRERHRQCKRCKVWNGHFGPCDGYYWRDNEEPRQDYIECLASTPEDKE